MCTDARMVPRPRARGLGRAKGLEEVGCDLMNRFAGSISYVKADLERVAPGLLRAADFATFARRGKTFVEAFLEDPAGVLEELLEAFDYDRSTVKFFVAELVGRLVGSRARASRAVDLLLAGDVEGFRSELCRA
ncbi:MAG: hypothetical protein ABWK00_05565 [Desulfurococcaceae archaeon]